MSRTHNNAVVVLNVAEKPSVARSIASVFEHSTGSIKHPPIPGQAAQVFLCENVFFPPVLSQGSGRVIHTPDVPHTMVTTSVRGHLASTEFPPQYGWSKCQPVTLFGAPIETHYKPDMEPLRQMLRTQVGKCEALILWIDCDREGEAICDEIREVCLSAKPRLVDRVYRARFSTVLPGEIKRALKSLGRINENFVQAVKARSEHDFRVGAAFTRFQTLRLQKKFEAFADGGMGVISYGPCQFPTLGFVVERWARIETFVPEDFWFLEMSIRVTSDGIIMGSNDTTNSNNNTLNNNTCETSTIVLKWKRDRLHDRIMTMGLYESCLEVGDAFVTDMTGRPKNKWRPLPLATVELQKRAIRYLKISSESAMTAAEELYQQGYISYPRTETEKFHSEFDHLGLIKSFQNMCGVYGEYATKLLSSNNFKTPRAGLNDDNAHPPITPAKAVDPQTITNANQRGIYTLVVKHYLACCSMDAVGRETTLKLQMASEEFGASGLMIIERNWLEIYAPWERWCTGQGELPRVNIGVRISPSTLLMKEGQTTAPQPISEVELISLMDRNGIGTDATIAQHITTIQERAYATKNSQQKFLPSKLGIALVEGYNSMGYQLNKPYLRREMEAECNAVAMGRKTKDEIMTPLLAKMLECFNHANCEVHKLDYAVARHFSRIGTSSSYSSTLSENFSVCGKCHGMMTLKQMNNQNLRLNFRPITKMLHCKSCLVGLIIPKGVPIPMTNSQSQDQAFLCPICQYQVIKITTGEGYSGNGYQFCPRCFSDIPTEYFDSSTSSEFRCFNCTHPTCSIASGTKRSDIQVYPCPFCYTNNNNNGKITLSKRSKSYTLLCSNNTGNREGCDYIVWLPKEARTISIPGSGQNNSVNDSIYCNSCSSLDKRVRKIKIVWKPGSVPPHFGREFIGCVLCDDLFKSEIRVLFPHKNHVYTRKSNRHRKVKETGSGVRKKMHTIGDMSNSRFINKKIYINSHISVKCFRCGNNGHYANQCPQA